MRGHSPAAIGFLEEVANVVRSHNRCSNPLVAPYKELTAQTVGVDQKQASLAGVVDAALNRYSRSIESPLCCCELDFGRYLKTVVMEAPLGLAANQRIIEVIAATGTPIACHVAIAGSLDLLKSSDFLAKSHHRFVIGSRDHRVR